MEMSIVILHLKKNNTFAIMRTILISTLAFVVMLIFLQGCNRFEMEVRKSVNRQMNTYPESTLKDLYKSFFQDRFGPGHIIGDTTAAKNYLLSELASDTTTSGELTEATGWKQNFYRVNLSAVKNNLVSQEVLLDALIRSANEVEPITIEEWRKEWNKIEAVIKAMNLALPDYENDSEDINEKLKKGNYVGHHSEAYNKAYKPHYRIISKKIFKKEILPLIVQSGMKNKNELLR